MSFTSSTNRWASKVVIVLQLTTWSAVSIVLLQRGVSSLQRRMLDSHVIESIQSGSREMDRHTDYHDLDYKNTSSRVLRITRDKEHILDGSEIIHARENRGGFVNPPELPVEAVTWSSLEEEVSSPGNATGREIADFPEENTSAPSKVQKPSSLRGRTGEQRVASTLGRSKSRTSFSRMSDGGATTAIAMVVIGTIMLLLGPAVIVLRILDERKRTRKLLALSAAAREDLPPAYEQVVFLSEAPRYSTLSLNADDCSSPSSPSAAASLIKSEST